MSWISGAIGSVISAGGCESGVVGGWVEGGGDVVGGAVRAGVVGVAVLDGGGGVVGVVSTWVIAAAAVGVVASVSGSSPEHAARVSATAAAIVDARRVRLIDLDPCIEPLQRSGGAASACHADHAEPNRPS